MGEWCPGPAKVLTVFHGTSATAADAIMIMGFEGQDWDHRTRQVASHHGVDPEVLAGALDDFTASRRDRPYVSVTTNPYVASSYARRGSEVDYFLLQAVYRVQRGIKEGAHQWAREMAARAVQPVVVQLEVPWAEMSERIQRRVGHLRDVPPEHRFGARSEILLDLPVPTRWIKHCHPVAACRCWEELVCCEVCRQDLELRQEMVDAYLRWLISTER